MGVVDGKVFVSSTVFDLVDVRAEIEQHLREIGLSPSMSDSPESEFDVGGRRDSIEACLTNVRNSEVFLCVLSRRYGPSLKKAGFEAFSATHLEYREARRAGKPVYFFVRDHLDVEWNRWVTKRRPETWESRWILDENPLPLLRFIDAHMKLSKGSEDSNWRDVFASSAELKRIVSQRLRRFSSRAQLRQLLRAGTLPFFALSRSSTSGSDWGFTIENVGSTAALEVIAVGAGTRRSPVGMLTLGRVAKFRLPRTHTRPLVIEYSIPQGHRLADEFEIEETTGAASLLSKRHLSSETFVLLSGDEQVVR